jgi:hypothetical protein
MPDDRESRVNPLVHEAEIPGQREIPEPPELNHSSVFSQFHNMDFLRPITCIVKSLQTLNRGVAIQGDKVLAKSDQENPLEVSQPRLGYGFEANIEDHILFLKEPLDPFIKANKNIC